MSASSTVQTNPTMAVLAARALVDFQHADAMMIVLCHSENGDFAMVITVTIKFSWLDECQG